MKKATIIMVLILIAAFFYPKKYDPFAAIPYPGPNGEIPAVNKDACFGFDYETRCFGLVISVRGN